MNLVELEIGSRGEEVRSVQRKLAALGFYRGDLDGKFGPLTAAAVKAFRAAVGLAPGDTVGPAVARVLMATPVAEGEKQKQPATEGTEEKEGEKQEAGAGAPGSQESLLSPAGEALILEFEVGGGKDYYERFLMRPTVPGEASGVTIGVGYDLGYESGFDRDWGMLREDWRMRLRRCVGKTRGAASAACGAVRDILIPWETALDVYRRVTLPREYELTRRTYPGLEALPKDAQAALVSLIFNRGSSLEGPRRREMLAIRGMVLLGDLAGIARKLREMKRLWPDMRGLIRRREAEARLVESARG